MKTKYIIITIAIIIASFSKAQIKVFVNDKQIETDSTINFNDIK